MARIESINLRLSRIPWQVWLLAGLVTLGVIGLKMFAIRSEPDVLDDPMSMIPPDSLKAYTLNSVKLRTMSEWEAIRNGKNPGSVDDWLRHNYVAIQNVGLVLLEQATLFRDRGEMLRADTNFKTAREIGMDLATVFQDSFLLKQVDRIDKLGPKPLRQRAQASALYAHAYELLFARKLSQSRQVYERALELARKAGDPKLEIDAMVSLQWFLLGDDNHQAVIELGEQIVEKGERVGYKRRVATALRQMTESYRELDMDSEAIATLEQSIAIATFLQDTGELASSYFSLAQVRYRMEDFQRADSLLQVLPSIDKKGIYLNRARITRGSIYYEFGEYGRAMSLYQQAVSGFHEQGDRLNEAIGLSRLALLHYRLGEYENALTLEQKSFAIRRELGNESRVANSLRSLGLIHSATDSLAKAAESYRRALKLSQPNGNRSACNIWLGLGGVKLKQNDLSSANLAFATADSLATVVNYQLGKAEAFWGHGKTALARGQLPLARESFGKVIQISEQIQEPRLQAMGLFGVAKVEKKSGQLESSTQTIARAIDLVERLRTGVRQDSLRMGYFATIQEMFDEAILSCIALGRNKVALHYAERARARSLVDAIANPTLIGVEKDRWQLLENEVPSIDEMLRSIPNSVQVIEYRITRDTLLIWLMDKGAIHLSLIPESSTAIESKVRQFLRSIGAEELATFKAKVRKNIQAVYDENVNLGAALYELLIRPVSGKIIPGKQLLILPDGILHRLPFGALVTEADSFFDERYVWAKAPSLTVLHRSSKSPPENFGLASARFLMVAGDLPSTRIQKRSIRRLFQNATILENQLATYETMKSHLEAGPQIVYLNVHAVADPHHPLNSYIVLHSDNGTNGRTSWSKVYARRLLQLSLSSTKLAVLSACETSSGKVLRGEGVLNLVRVFSLSQVPFVIASLWKNDDRRSASLTGELFHEVVRGTPVIEALHRAKKQSIQALREEDGYPLPYFWAVFELYQNAY